MVTDEVNDYAVSDRYFRTPDLCTCKAIWTLKQLEKDSGEVCIACAAMFTMFF